jgi:hypothetical protein
MMLLLQITDYLSWLEAYRDKKEKQIPRFAGMTIALLAAGKLRHAGSE